MESTNIKPMLFLVAGLLIGSLGIYLVLNNAAQATNQEILTQIRDLNQTVYDLRLELDSNSTTLKQLGVTVSAQSGEIGLSKENLYAIAMQMDSLQSRLGVLENKYNVLDEKNNGYVVEVRNLKEFNSNLIQELGLPSGYTIYLDHDIKFLYPEEMNITESGMSYTYATNHEGVVTGTILNGDAMEVMATDWRYDFFGAYSNNIQSQLDSLNSLPAYGLNELQLTGTRQTTCINHTVYYRSFTSTTNGVSVNGSFGIWYCGLENRVHEMVVFTTSSDYERVFMDYVDGFRCHK